MALGRAETETLFTRSIRPALTQLGIGAVVINRREDNRDITTQVMEQLDRADLCIADLTYARPSVYFEAGYAERVVEVIYTAREDHLSRGGKDDARVHFDLEHRPIVAWRTPDSAEFRARLTRRVKATFLRTWLKTSAQDRALDAGREAFAMLSAADREVAMLRCARKQLEARGFSVQGMSGVRLPPGPVFTRRRAKRLDLVMVLAPIRAVHTTLRSYLAGHWLSLVRAALTRDAMAHSRLRESRFGVLLISDRGVRRETIGGSLTAWKPERTGRRWVDRSDLAAELRDGVRYGASHLAVADNVRSEKECETEVKVALRELLDESMD